MKFNRIKNLFLCSVGLSFLLEPSSASSVITTMARSLSSTANVYAVHHPLRFYNTLPEGFKLIELSQKGLAPWSDKKQKNNSSEEITPIDISKFCADRERGLLYRFQSWKEIESEKKEKFPLPDTKLETFDRCSEQPDLSDLVESMGLVESSFKLEAGVLSAIGTGLIIRSDAILTAAHNLTFEPEDGHKIKHQTTAKSVKFHPKYDSGKPLKTFKIADYKVPNEWSLAKDPAYDFAVLFLKNSELKPKIRLASIEKGRTLPISTTVAGYPKDILSKAGLKIQNEPLSSYAHNGELKKISDCYRFIDYNCFTDEGMSGGPVLIRDLPMFSIGIHTNGGEDLNWGVHYTDHVVSYLNKWFNERDETTISEDDIILKTIKEISTSEAEKEYLNSHIDVLREYPKENLRSYLTIMVHMYRSKK